MIPSPATMSLLGVGAVVAALLYLAFILAESALLAMARRRIRIVVHVNGTRGKTETTRLLAAALRAGGVRTLAKTTGTEACLLLPDGREQPLRRLGAPNVREQRNVLLRAAFLRAEALVVECMAVSPETQAASTDFLAPSILVITNVRPDHQAEQGTPEQALDTFLEGIPPGGLVATADPAIFQRLEAAAAIRQARAVLAAPLEGSGGRIPENAGLALAISEYLGIASRSAIEGMRGHLADQGAFAVRRLSRSDGEILIVDALAANDPESTALLFQRAEARVAGRGPRVLLFTDRRDRADRTSAFADWIAGQGRAFDALLLAGRFPPKVKKRLVAAFPGLDALGRSRVRHLNCMADLALEPAGTVVFAGGNWKIYGPALAALAPALEEQATGARA